MSISDDKVLKFVKEQASKATMWNEYTTLTNILIEFKQDTPDFKGAKKW